MTTDTDMKRDDATFAGEFAIGLLQGEELLSARGRVASDAKFAALVDGWNAHMAPLLDDVTPVEPSDTVWAQIQARVNAARTAQAQAELAGGGGSASNVVDLNARLRRWQWTAGLTSAAAALALAFVAFAPQSNPVGPVDGAEGPALAIADPLVAQVPIGDTGLRLDVTYIPETEKMLVGAIGLTADGVHDHELWLVPADGSDLQSLGVVAPGEVRSMELPDEITRNLADGAQLVLTREPIGGKPEGVDAGPVVAEGEFTKV